MVSEKNEMNGRAAPAAESRFSVGPRTLAADALRLAELQVELLRADLAAARQAARLTVVLLVIVVALMIAAAPVLLFALAAWMEGAFDLSRALSMLLAGSGAVVLGAILLFAALMTLKHGVSRMGRSHEEFRQNLAWMKATLTGNHRPPN